MADERLDFDLVAKDRASREFDRVGDAAVRAGRDFDKASDGAGQLQMQIDDTTRSLHQLGIEFDKTGNKSLLKDIGRERRTLAGLTKLRKEMAGLADATGDVGKASGRGFSDALGALPSQLKGALILAAVGAAATAAPAIGAIIGGAIVTGVGAAGIGAGVALAFTDSRVDKAAGDLGMRAKNAFVDASAGMVQPTIDALDVLGDAAADVAREMGGMWDDLAPEVVPLAEAIGDMARNAMPGLRDAIEVAKPALRVLARELPEIGDAFSDMFSTISEEGDGALLGLMAALDLAEGAIRFTGDAVAFLSSMFEESVRKGAAFTGVAEDIWGWMPLVGDRLRSANDHTEDWLKTLEESKSPSDTATRAFRDVGNAAEDAGKEAEESAKRYEELFGLWMDVDTSAIAVQQAIDDLTESFRDNGTTLDINTESGRKNASQLLDAAEAAKAHEQAMIRDGKSASFANQVFLETVQGLYNQARAAGASTAELDALLGKYLRLAAAKDIVKTITYRQVFTQHGQVFQPQGGGHQFFADGGPVSGPGPKGVDSVPAMLAPGEFVINSRAVDRIGLANLARLNSASVGAATAAPFGQMAPAMSAGDTHFHFHGPVGSRMELENWLTRAVDSLRRKGRV